MVAIQLTGNITEDGELEVELPEGLPPGKVQVTIEVAGEESPWTDEEILEMMQVTPKTGAEIVAEIEAGLLGEGWSDIKISGAEWVEEQRRKWQERSQW